MYIYIYRESVLPTRLQVGEVGSSRPAEDDGLDPRGEARQLRCKQRGGGLLTESAQAQTQTDALITVTDLRTQLQLEYFVLILSTVKKRPYSLSPLELG